MRRGAGILMHISSIPSNQGIGTFGPKTYDFVDLLFDAGQKYWQILPLGPTSYGDSPYQSFSSFAINPYFIDFEILENEGLIEKYDWADLDFGNDETNVDFYKIFINKEKGLRKAFEKAKLKISNEINDFANHNYHWLEDYAFYMALKVKYDLHEWSLWDEDIKKRHDDAIIRYKEELSDDIYFWKFIQYIAYKQWRDLKEYANSRGLLVIGDIPIYTAYDSADVWANIYNGLFKLDADLLPEKVAGCPPDCFTEVGQLWGNPVYNWEKNEETEYAWWISRIKHSFYIYDIVRIDHFRGFESYWEIPYGAPNAINGEWVPGPRLNFINTLKRELGDVMIIAEDLGFMTEAVLQMNKDSGYPGMKILQFAFNATEETDSLPHKFEHNCVVYTGTHDNTTLAQWLSTAVPADVQVAVKYLGLTKKEGYNWGFIRGAYASVADMAIIPMQDILGLGADARMNFPSTLGGINWQWRMKDGDFTEIISNKLKELTQIYYR